ncbi:MAG: molybdenum cofactor guanylyltransferase [Chloroflexi bacterium]|nr:molybdenum cofactor guanylyltransferase [Chloroflexota bacterium]MBU1746624.1 molybdenum cofactor guanylyltransferase [Chloroflexota bacterium]
MNPGLTGLILAGGHSHRLGQDKALVRLDETGPTLIERVAAVVQPLCDEVLVVGGDPARYAFLGLPLVPDVYAGAGALGGIYAGLCAARHEYALAVACDMPFLNAALLRYMADQPRDYDVLVPRWATEAGGKGQLYTPKNELAAQTLHAIYGRACQPPMRALIEAGERRIIAFFPQVRVRTIEPDQVARFDPTGRSFFNVNTPAQWHQAMGQPSS